MKHFLFATLIACALSLAWGHVAHAADLQQTGPISTTYVGTCSSWYTGIATDIHGDWGLSNVWTPTIPVSSTFVGLIDQLHDVTYGGNVDMRWTPLSSGGSNENIPDTCGNYHTAGDPDTTDFCALVGRTNNFTFNEWYGHATVGGWYQNGVQGGTWKARVCPIFRGPIGVYPECGVVITDTHFMFQPTTWQATSATWTFSVFSISDGGHIQKSGFFTQTGTYSITVLAQAATTATLTAGIGSSSSSVTVVPTEYSSGFSTYGLTATVSTGGNLVVSLAAAGGAIRVDRICLSPAMLAFQCMMVRDPDFLLSTSWVPIGSAAWFQSDGTANGVWIVGAGAIVQSIPDPLMQVEGSYTVTVLAKASAPTVLDISVDGSAAGTISISPSSEYINFSGEFTVTTAANNGSHLFSIGRSTLEGSLLLDFLCIYPVTNLYGAGPCGMTPGMVAESHRYLSNSDFSNALHLPYFQFNVSFPLGINVVGVDTSIIPDAWMSLGVVGLYRTRAGGNAVGVMPLPLYTGFFQQLHASPGGGYNIYLRMRRTYANSNLIVGDKSTAGTPLNEWTDFGFYMTSGDSVNIKANCIDLSSGAATWCVQGVDNRGDVVDVDDVYVVPGPEVACGSVITTPFTPPGDCINPDPTFSFGAGTWEAGNGARIILNQAEVPSGGYIRQYVPVGSMTTSTWQQIVSSLIVGGNYTITIAARAQDTSNSLRVAVGASTPGEVDLETSPFDSSSTVTEWTGGFTLSSDMVVNGGMPLQITAKDGGTLIIVMVCIRAENPITPPVGGCLGSWTASSGGAALNTTISPPDYVLNHVSLTGGQSYNLIAQGTRPSAGKMTIVYVSNGVTQYSMDVQADTSFNVTQGFVAPQVESGELRVYADGDVEYTNLCLQTNGGPPVVVPPGPLPYPECRTEAGLMIQPAPNSGFFMLPQYAVSNEYSTTTETPAAYVAELTYNYAIYPLVCTSVSIANWQYAAYQSLLAILKQWFGPGSWLEKWLSDILDAIRAIQIPPGGGGGGTTLWDLLLWLLKMLLALLLKILQIVGILFTKLLEGAKSINKEVRSDSAVMYPIDCNGDAQYMCFGLAALLAADNSFGDWLNIIALIVDSVLTVSLVLWVLNQFRQMFQPGSGGDEE